MRFHALNTRHNEHTTYRPMLTIAPDLSSVCEMREEQRDEILAFLKIRPVHTIVMTGFVIDNGIESPLNRGTFFGYRNAGGKLEGIALIGHATLVEARSEQALKALAFAARNPKTPLHLVMSSGSAAETFWNHYAGGSAEPRLVCTERLFELSFPFPVQRCDHKIRQAKPEELIEIAEAQAEVAFAECGVNPIEKDREGFLKRVMRRIEQGRIFVSYDGDKLVFKADIISETDDAIYLEGIYVNPEYRGQGIGSKCLAKLSMTLLERVGNICLLSNVDLHEAHRSFAKAGFRSTETCTTLFV